MTCETLKKRKKVKDHFIWFQFRFHASKLFYVSTNSFDFLVEHKPSHCSTDLMNCFWCLLKYTANSFAKFLSEYFQYWRRHLMWLNALIECLKLAPFLEDSHIFLAISISVKQLNRLKKFKNSKQLHERELCKKKKTVATKEENWRQF